MWVRAALSRWRRWQVLVLVVVLLLATGTAAMFGVRTYRSYHDLRAARAGDVSIIRGWMNLRYIARAYHVLEPELKERLGLPPDADSRAPLGALANRAGRTRAEYVEDVRHAVAALREASPGAPQGGGP